jgi:hypothetical protein
MTRDRITDILVEALKQALSSPGEQRLYRSGKLDGLFPGRTGVNGEAAARALRDGLLEVVRTEMRGKTSCDWVRLTPGGVEFLSEHESPVRALEDLRQVLRANEEAVPVWLAGMRQELQVQAERLEQTARGWLDKLDALGRRVDEALTRLQRPALPEDLLNRVPWAPAVLDYLDRREEGGAPPCVLPELFEALRGARIDLSVSAFHDGLRQLSERRALRLLPADHPEVSQPEFALFDGTRVLYAAAL